MYRFLFIITILLSFGFYYKALAYSQDGSSTSAQVPVRAKDAIPDDKDFAPTPDGRLVRKGTIKALRDNIVLLETLLDLPEGEVRKQKIMACTDVLTEMGQDLYSIGIFDWFFTVQEWLQNDQKPARIMVVLSCLPVFIGKMTEEEKAPLQQRLGNLKTTIKIPEIKELVENIEKKILPSSKMS